MMGSARSTIGVLAALALIASACGTSGQSSATPTATLSQSPSAPASPSASPTPLLKVGPAIVDSEHVGELGYGGLWLAPSSGGTPVKIVPASSYEDFSWSPLGEQLAVAIGEAGSNTGLIEFFNGAGILKRSVSLPANPRKLYWSNDGTMLAVSAYGANIAFLYSLQVDNGEPVEIARVDSNQQYMDAAGFLADGRLVISIYSNGQYGGAVFAYNVEDGSRVRSPKR